MVLIFIFLMTNVWNIYYVLIGHLYICYREISRLLLIFNWVICLFFVELLEFNFSRYNFYSCPSSDALRMGSASPTIIQTIGEITL